MSILIQILTGTKNFRILPDFQISSLARSRVIKNLIFEPNFWNNSKFLDVVKFYPSQVQSVQKSRQMFDATENFWILPNFILRMLPVVKNVSFELNFWHESKCWLCKMSSFAGQEWSNSWFLAKFSTRLKISGFAKFHPSQVWSGQKSIFEPDFQHKSNFSGFCQISSFAGSEWSTLSFFS